MWGDLAAGVVSAVAVFFVGMRYLAPREKKGIFADMVTLRLSADTVDLHTDLSKISYNLRATEGRLTYIGGHVASAGAHIVDGLVFWLQMADGQCTGHMEEVAKNAAEAHPVLQAKADDPTTKPADRAVILRVLAASKDMEAYVATEFARLHDAIVATIAWRKPIATVTDEVRLESIERVAAILLLIKDVQSKGAVLKAAL